mmetsp:Transcript_502/g.1070  ORF Transcript_502/g.1070 Transcript_502/m.1070 type:complete len:241 (-) Transcript_502:865-1587(-)
MVGQGPGRQLEPGAVRSLRGHARLFRRNGRGLQDGVHAHAPPAHVSQQVLRSGGSAFVLARDLATGYGRPGQIPSGPMRPPGCGLLHRSLSSGQPRRARGGVRVHRGADEQGGAGSRVSVRTPAPHSTRGLLQRRELAGARRRLRRLRQVRGLVPRGVQGGYRSALRAVVCASLGQHLVREADVRVRAGGGAARLRRRRLQPPPSRAQGLPAQGARAAPRLNQERSASKRLHLWGCKEQG